MVIFDNTPESTECGGGVEVPTTDIDFSNWEERGIN